MNDLGNLLKRLRGNLSLREVAARGGLSYSYISSLEKGKHPRTGAPIKPTPDKIRGLAKAYNYSYDELMKIAGYSEDGNINNYIVDLYDQIKDPNDKHAAEEFLKHLADKNQQIP